MKASGIAVAKPLVAVEGVPLVERNLAQLLRHGLRDLVVAVPAGGSPVEEHARRRLVPLAAAAGARLRVLVEEVPLGTIGCAGMLHGEGPVLAVFADNLTSLDLGDLLAYHHGTGAALTLAAHDERLPLPRGRLLLAGAEVVACDGDAEVSVTVASGIAVLGAAATAVLAPGRRAGLPELAAALLRAGRPVAAYAHRAAWVDVNDATALRRAEALLREDGAAFEGGVPA